jgi:hypothetical protein
MVNVFLPFGFGTGGARAEWQSERQEVEWELVGGEMVSKERDLRPKWREDEGVDKGRKRLEYNRSLSRVCGGAE